MHARTEASPQADLIDRALTEPLPTYRRAAVTAATGEGRVICWNAGAERLFGWPEREALGKNMLGLTPAAPTRDRAAEILAYLQSGRFWSGEMAVHRRCGLPLIVFMMQFPLGDLTHGRGAIVGVTVPTIQRRLVAGDAAHIAAALQRRLSKGGCVHPIGGPRMTTRPPIPPRLKPGRYIPIGSTERIAALHRNGARPQGLWRLMQRIETYRYRAEQLADGPDRLRSGRSRLARMWRDLAEELHRAG